MYEIEFEFNDTGSGEFRLSDNVIQAINNYLKQDDINQAASLLAASDSEMGDLLVKEAEVGASREHWKKLAKLFGAVRDVGRAAMCAEAVGDHELAAGFHEAAYDWDKAADAYKKAKKPLQAAEMYERGLNFDKAAAIYMEGKDYLRAAGCFTKAGAFYHAGHLYLKAGRYNQAIEVLQKINRGQKWFIEASTLLGRFFEKGGNTTMAVEHYVEVVRAKQIDASTVDVHYRLGALLYKEKQLPKAEYLWKLVLSVQPDHKGAIEGLKLLKGKHGEGPPPAPPRATVGQDMSQAAAAQKMPGMPALPELPRLTALPNLPKAPASPAAPAAKSDGGTPLLVLPGDEDLGVDPKKKKRPKSMVMMRSDFEIFRTLPVFAELSLDELKLVHTLADRMTFEPGQVLIEQGEPGRALFVIASGKVKVELISESRIPVLAATLGPGASLGEMAMVDEAPASARVSALDRVNAFCFPIERLRRHLITEPLVGFKVMKVLGRILSTRLREANISLSK